MRDQNRLKILLAMKEGGQDVYTSSGLYKIIKNYYSSDLSARLDDLYHMGMVIKVKTKGKNLYYLTSLAENVSTLQDLNCYMGGLLSYKKSCPSAKKTRAESEAKKLNKEINDGLDKLYGVVEVYPPIQPTTVIGKIRHFISKHIRGIE